jgi:hypothetical protein
MVGELMDDGPKKSGNNSPYVAFLWRRGREKGVGVLGCRRVGEMKRRSTAYIRLYSLIPAYWKKIILEEGRNGNGSPRRQAGRLRYVPTHNDA